MWSAVARIACSNQLLQRRIAMRLPRKQPFLLQVNNINFSAYSSDAAATNAKPVSAKVPSKTQNTLPPFTMECMPQLKRKSNFAKLTDQDVSHFRSILSPNSVLYSPEGQPGSDHDLLPYNLDWMRKYRGQSRLVLRPRTTKEVSEIMKYCHHRRLAVVPQGGNTGLVGGGVAVFDEIVISMAGMDKIRSFDPASGVLVSDAGCVLEALDDYLAERGYMMPLDLGSKGSCRIGGNVATNAGGIRLLRYGSLHGNVLGLEVVMPDGTILNNLSTLRKDNTGYDIKQLFIGSEGTLGIITGVSIITPKRPKAVNVALLGVPSFDSVHKAFEASREDLCEILSAFEFWDSTAMDLVFKHLMHVRKALDSRYPFYVLVETSGSCKEHDETKLDNYLEKLMEEGIVDDGVVAQDSLQAAQLWSLRKGVLEACSKVGAVYKYDISMPVPVQYKMVEDVYKRLADAGIIGENKNVTDVIGYGHVGDGNLHVNITAKMYDSSVQDIIDTSVYEWAAEHHGSISAEHGLGVTKTPYLKYSKRPEMIDMMRRIKKMMDPNGIMNPYKFLPLDSTGIKEDVLQKRSS